MRQRVTHGAMLDFATPDEVGASVAKALDARESLTYRREKQSGFLDATGAGVITFKTTRLYDWLCERVTVTSGPSAIIQFYENSVQPSDMLEVVGLGTAGLYSDSFSNSLYVPAGSQLLVVTAGGAANGQTTVNLQIKLIRTQP